MREDHEALQRECRKMLHELEKPPAAKKAKDAVKAMLGRGSGEKDPIFWPAGFLLYGLSFGDEKSVKEAADHLGRWLSSGGAVTHVDDALAGCAALRLEAMGKVPAEAADRIYGYLTGAEKDPGGSVIYHPEQGSRYVFADGAGMCTMFLADYAAARREDAAVSAASIALAEKQIANYLKYGMDGRTGLPYHGYLLGEDGSSAKQGLVGWGRAVGFLLMGMAALVRAGSLMGNAGSAININEAYSALLVSTFRYLRKDGLLSWLIPADEGHVDTSASAMAALSVRIAGISGNSAGVIAQAIEDSIVDGRLVDSLAECRDFAEHPQRFGIYPWGMGAALALLEWKA